MGTGRSCIAGLTDAPTPGIVRSLTKDAQGGNVNLQDLSHVRLSATILTCRMCVDVQDRSLVSRGHGNIGHLMGAAKHRPCVASRSSGILLYSARCLCKLWTNVQVMLIMQNNGSCVDIVQKASVWTEVACSTWRLESTTRRDLGKQGDKPADEGRRRVISISDTNK
jgi:hypothetical protein